VKPGPNDSWMVRRRSLVLAGALVVAVVATGLLAGKHGGPTVASVHVQFGPSLQPPPHKLTFTNGWVAVTGRQKVAVYAGSQPGHTRNGMLVAVVNVDGQSKRNAAILVAGAGALTLLRPAAFNTIQAAGQATLHFVTASGGTGTLDLSTDKVTLSQ
jgi:hypothetical protein